MCRRVARGSFLQFHRYRPVNLSLYSCSYGPLSLHNLQVCERDVVTLLVAQQCTQTCKLIRHARRAKEAGSPTYDAIERAHLCGCTSPPPRREEMFIAPPPKKGTAPPPSPMTEAAPVSTSSARSRLVKSSNLSITDAFHKGRRHKQPHSSVQSVGRDPKYIWDTISLY